MEENNLESRCGEAVLKEIKSDVKRIIGKLYELKDINLKLNHIIEDLRDLYHSRPPPDEDYHNPDKPEQSY